MDCPARQLCDYFTSTILLTTDFCGTIPRPTIKTTNLMQGYGTICIFNVFLLSEREISPNYTGIFLDFVHGFGSYVKGLPKTKRCNSVAVTVSVRFRFGFGVYVKQPLVLRLFYRSQMVNFKENYHFSRFWRGLTFSSGVKLFPVGSNCLFPIETHITCDFQAGVRTPCPPPLLWIRTWPGEKIVFQSRVMT